MSQALRAFEGQALVYASRFIPDATVRREYIGRAQEVSRSTRQLYNSGTITARQAEEIAHRMRGEIMEFARAKTSDMGKSVAAVLKDKNIPLDELLTDADDVAYLYVKLVRKYGGVVEQALKLHPTARQLLIDTLESGWTDADERRAIDYLKSLA